MRRILLFLFLICIANISLAGVLKGRVVDARGEALSYATIYVEGTTIGTNANSDGAYELTMAPGTYVVICQYVGYQQSRYNITFKGEEANTHNFTLAAQGLEMKEAVIHANSEDPAYGIIREAIKRRKFHLGQIKSFQTGIYLKGVGRSRSSIPKKVMGMKVSTEDVGADTSGKGILYLLEEDADYYVQGEQERTVIHSVRESGNPGGVGFSQFPSVISFYDNNVGIFGRTSRGYISPISDNALNYYKYKFQGQFEEQGHTIYKVEVMQKRPYEPCFNGYIYIVKDDWAIHTLKLTLTKQSGLDRMDTLSVNQLYLPYKDDTWVIKSQIVYLTVKIFGFDIVGSGVTVYNKQRVNEPIADTMFSKKLVSSYDKVANKKDSTYWEANRPIPLEAEEKKDFVVKDSLRVVYENPVRIDSERKKANKPKPIGVFLRGYTYTGKKSKNVFSFNSVLLGLGEDNIINFNAVEGFNIAPKMHWVHTLDTVKYLTTDVAARYGFSNTHFNAIGRLYYNVNDRAWRGRSWTGGIEGGKYVFQYDANNPVLQWFNTYASLFVKENDLRIYERWEGSAFLRRNYGNGLTWLAKASYQHRLPLANTTDFSFTSANTPYYNNLTANLAQTATAWEEHDAMILYGMVSYKPGYTYTQYPDYKVANGSKWPRFTLAYEKGVAGILNSKTDYDKWKFNVQDDVSLRLLGRLSYNFAVGGFLNAKYVSIPDLMHLYGNRGIGYASPYLQSFQFAQYYEFSNKESFYGEGHVEYHLNGLLSNKIPLLRQARWYLLFGGNAFYTNDKNYYTEAFVGVDNIGWKAFRLLRVDFVQSWDSHMGTNSGIRFGFNLSAFLANKTNVSHSEW